MKPLSCAPLSRKLLALPESIRLSWKSLPGSNTLAYSKLLTKKFYNIGPRLKNLANALAYFFRSVNNEWGEKVLITLTPTEKKSFIEVFFRIEEIAKMGFHASLILLTLCCSTFCPGKLILKINFLIKTFGSTCLANFTLPSGLL